MHLAKFCGFVWAFATLALAVTGCTGSDNDNEDDDSTTLPEGRGSDTCRRWQGELCDWLERCGGSASEVTGCREQASGISCLDDADAAACADSLSSASCSTPPTGCDLYDNLDPGPAISACNDYVDVFCDRMAECPPITRQSCLDEVTLAIDCNAALAVKLSYEQCLIELPTMACDGDLPVPCQGMILF